MFRQTKLPQISESEESHSHVNLMRKRVRPTSQFGSKCEQDECNLGKQKKIKGVKNLEDRISELPDDVLVIILSLLPLKQAASTSILSRRWRYVWECTMTLEFDDINFEEGNNLKSFLKLKPQVKDQQMLRYVSCVNRVLERHRGPNIQRFKAHFFLDYRFKNSIDKWIQFAMERKIPILELEFFEQDQVCYWKYMPVPDGYRFPHELLGITDTSINQEYNLEKYYSAWKRSPVEKFMHSAWENLLFSDSPDIHFCGYSAGFKSLKVLHVRQVRMSDEAVEHLLSNCPVLERLSLILVKNLVQVRVVGPQVAVKHLVIKHCHDLKSIEICNANIASFTYSGSDMVDLLLSNVPLLVELSIPKRLYCGPSLIHNSTQLSCVPSRLEILKLDNRGTIYRENGVFPISPKLKHLELIVSADYHQGLHYLTSVLKTSPRLQRLVLKVEMIERRREILKMEKAAAKCPHHYLKVVEVAGYRARACVVEHVMYLIENAVALEKLVINPVRSWFWPPGMVRATKEVREEVMARDHAMQHLKGKVPSNIEFVCL